MIDYLEIGRIVNTHGIRGELKVLPLTDDPERFRLLKEILVEQKGELKKIDIESIRIHKGNVLVVLKGIDIIEKAELLKGTIITVHRKDAIKLPENKFFICDMLGLAVFDQNEQLLGTLKDIIKTGSNDVYIIDCNGKDLLIPALKSVVQKIDFEEGKIKVILPEEIESDEV